MKSETWLPRCRECWWILPELLDPFCRCPATGTAKAQKRKQSPATYRTSCNEHLTTSAFFQCQLSNRLSAAVIPGVLLLGSVFLPPRLSGVLDVGTDLGTEVVERHFLSAAFAGDARDAAVHIRHPRRRNTSLPGNGETLGLRCDEGFVEIWSRVGLPC